MKTQSMKTTDLVDALGILKAELAELTKKEKAIKAAIAGRMDARGVEAIEGEFYRVVRVTAERESIDTEAVKRLLADPPVKRSSVTTYRVNARISETA